VDALVDVRDLERIKQGDRLFLKELYRANRSAFLKWALWRYSCSEEDIADIYQQAFVILYNNVKAGKFTGENSAIRTYLFGIGKNLLNKYVSTRRQQDDALDDVPEVSLGVDTASDGHETVHRQLMVQSILRKVGEPCRSILLKYYFENYSMEAIAENLGYKSALVAKKRKCECLMKIRKALNANFKT
jgi:RNA polymerase sigma-70 factor (ECF subfamily)